MWIQARKHIWACEWAVLFQIYDLAFVDRSCWVLAGSFNTFTPLSVFSGYDVLIFGRVRERGREGGREGGGGGGREEGGREGGREREGERES